MILSDQQYIDLARNLIAKLEAGRTDEATNVLEEITKLRESALFQEVGKLTRELHDALSNFQVDAKVTQLTETEIPDAKERLNHVITMTEEAANKTLGVVESTRPLSEQLERRSVELKSQWDRFRNREMQVEEFRGLSKEIDEFLSWTSENAVRIHGGLSEVMLAQDFQDLTGQIIRRVIKLVQDVEVSLVDLIKISGHRIKPAEQKTENDRLKAEGPSIPGVDDTSGVCTGQDEVDDLLSSLGF